MNGLEYVIMKENLSFNITFHEEIVEHLPESCAVEYSMKFSLVQK